MMKTLDQRELPKKTTKERQGEQRERKEQGEQKL